MEYITYVNTKVIIIHQVKPNEAINRYLNGIKPIDGLSFVEFNWTKRGLNGTHEFKDRYDKEIFQCT